VTGRSRSGGSGAGNRRGGGDLKGDGRGGGGDGGGRRSYFEEALGAEAGGRLGRIGDAEQSVKP
jgi:hypothetical protein